jgi:uroporphyrin-III C-methyltransferase/precorrin-2 dehydrogenase/sirohydrochlorin ferrochelatase
MSKRDHRSWPHPIFLDLEGQTVTVIGGGAVAERKIEALVAAGARVTVVSPDITANIARHAAEGTVSVERRAYRRGDLAGSRLAYAATSDAAVNQAVRDEARDLGVWLNAVDKPALCDFITPATVRRGHLTLAVSTNGRVPELSKQIREALESAYGPEYAELVDDLADARESGKRGGDAGAQAPGAEPGTVYLVGAGPGDPGLLTVRGRRLLGSADTVVYDALVDARLLDLCPAAASRIYVGKRSGRHARSQDEINGILVAEARAGRRVVRLKGGDPFVFGRGGEEAEAMAAAGVRFEVVPGVSAGVAAPAYAGIPLTHRSVTGEVVFVTGHDSGTAASRVDWARYGPTQATLVVFMGLENLRAITAALVAHGRDASCPAAIIAHGTTGAQQTVVAPLAGLADAAEAARVEAPAIIVIGEVVALRERLKWFGTDGGG